MKKANLHQNLPKDWEGREELRDKGQFWTPSWLAKAMVAYVAKETSLVFDPATGRGAFFEALRNLELPVNFFGTDIDKEMLQDPIYNHPSCCIEKRDFIANPPAKRFKAIVGNPPYIRHHRISKETKETLKHLATSVLGFPIDGRAGYHIYFLIQALYLLEPNGRLAFVMPADTCEGTFARDLWQWITTHYCLECAITFDKQATPFPRVDTNAVVFMIKKAKPEKILTWVKVLAPYEDELLTFVKSEFEQRTFTTLEIETRELSEVLQTGLSRPKQHGAASTYQLKDFAKVMRGIATGANEFFFLTPEQAKDLEIPADYLKLAVGRTRDVLGSSLITKDIQELERKGRPTRLLSITTHNPIAEAVQNYLKKGEELELPERALIKQRKPWYKMEQRKVPPLLFAYLGRRNSRFIKNDVGALPLTGFLCVYPLSEDTAYIHNLWQALNHPDTLENLKLVGKSYGSGAIKVEPRSLEKLAIPEHIIEKFGLIKKSQKSAQTRLFEEAA
jgi:adenine-specific DNA-methyltransferase